MAKEIGRPTKYKKNFPQKIEDYVKEKLSSGRLPTVEEISYRLAVNDDTVNEYSKKYPRFENAISRLKQVQSHLLQEKSLMGEWRNAMAIFMLKNNHKWTDKTDVELRTSSLDDIISLLKKERDVL